MGDGRVRVLALLKGLGPGGAEHLVLTAARQPEPAHSLEVGYVLDWKDHLVGPLADAGVPARCIGGRSLADLRWVPRLRRLLRTGRYDVVHVHSPVIAAATRVLWLTLRRRDRPALVSTEHNVWRSHVRLTRWANALTYPVGDAWLAVSEDVRNSLPARLRRRTEVLVHGIVLDDFDVTEPQRAAVRAELGAGDEDVVVLTVANLRRTKGYPDLLAAARQVLTDHRDVRFFAVGQGPLEGELRRAAEELGIADRFTFLGYRPDAGRLLGGADVFAIASHHEGYPIAVMEALAAGLPVVATTVGGIREAVTDGVNGRLVPAQATSALAEAIGSLVADPATRARMGRASRDAAESYDFRRTADRLSALYADLSGRRAAVTGR